MYRHSLCSSLRKLKRTRCMYWETRLDLNRLITATVSIINRTCAIIADTLLIALTWYSLRRHHMTHASEVVPHKSLMGVMLRDGLFSSQSNMTWTDLIQLGVLYFGCARWSIEKNAAHVFWIRGMLAANIITLLVIQLSVRQANGTYATSVTSLNPV